MSEKASWKSVPQLLSEILAELRLLNAANVNRKATGRSA